MLGTWETGGAVIITVNGRGDTVVSGLQDYYQMKPGLKQQPIVCGNSQCRSILMNIYVSAERKIAVGTLKYFCKRFFHYPIAAHIIIKMYAAGGLFGSVYIATGPYALWPILTYSKSSIV